MLIQKASRTKENQTTQLHTHRGPTTLAWRLYFREVLFKRLTTFCHAQENINTLLTQKSIRVTAASREYTSTGTCQIPPPSCAHDCYKEKNRIFVSL